MALAKPSISVGPAENAARIGAAIDALDALILKIQSFGDVTGGIQNAAAQAQAARDLVIDQVAGEAGQRASAVASVLQRLAAEEGFRAAGIAQLDDALDAESVNRDLGDKQLRDVITAEGRFRAEADDALSEDISEARASITAIFGAMAGLTEQLQAISAKVAAQRFELATARHRPGDSPTRFVTAVSPYALVSADALPVPGTIAAGSFGRVARLIGAGVIGMRAAVPIERGRVYRPRFSVARFANPSDPAGDALQFAVVYLDQGMHLLPDGVRIIAEIDDLTTAQGLRQIQAVMAQDAGPGITLIAPRRARYARACVRTFGPDGVTDVVSLDIVDVTDATVLDPVSSDVVARVATLESVDPGPRLSALEAQAAGPKSVTYDSKSDAAAATIPEAASVVRLLGRTVAGDGYEGLYARGVGGDDTFTSGGVTWGRITPAPGVVERMIGSWLDSLPTEVPSQPGRWWNNNGLLVRT